MDANPLPLNKRSCQACEGGVDPLDEATVEKMLADVEGWQLDASGKAIAKKLNCGDFVTAVARINLISEIAESEQHHPDLHLTGYRHLTIELTTHAIGGLSENDFIVAAKVDTALANV